MKRKFIPVDESFAQWKKDPEYAAAYASLEVEFLLDFAAEADAREGIRQGLEVRDRGEGRATSQFFEEMREKYGIPR